MPFPENHIKQFPFLRIVLAFAAGIVVQWYHPISIKYLTIGVTVTLAIFLSFQFFTPQKRFFLKHFEGVFLILLIFLTGSFIVYEKNIQNDAFWIGHHSYEGYVVKIEEPLTEKSKSYKSIASIHYLNKNRSLHPATGKIILYFKKEDFQEAPINYGSVLYIKKPLQPIKNSGNPGAFDYKTYCAFSNIYHQAFVHKKDVLITGVEQPPLFKKYKYDVSDYVIEVLKKHIKGKDEFAISLALLIGYRNFLDKDLIQSYSNTGVVHIIAISGLHLGIIFGLMRFLLKPFKGKIFKKSINPIIILFVIWSFAFIAGAAPSIVRAAIMFSIITSSAFFYRKGNMYNTLAASAFILLLFDPFSLWNAGFQLSYAAVFSIVFLYRPIYALMQFNHPLLDGLWSLTAVTLSAQIFTLPFVIYHFHQIPTLFLFSNLLAVPLSTIILVGEIFLVAIHYFSFSSFVGTALSGLLKILNIHIERLDAVPFGLIGNLQINIMQAALLILILFFISFWLMQKQPAYLKNAVFCFTIFICIQAYNAVKYYSNEKLLVYDVPKQKAIDIYKQGKYFFIGEEPLIKNDAMKNFHLGPSRIKFFSNRPLHHIITDETILIKGRKFKTLLVRNQFLPFKNHQPDIIVLSNDIDADINEMALHFPTALWVADASNSYKKISKWKKQAGLLHLRFHSVSEKGAFITDL